MWYEKFKFDENPYDIRNLSSKVIGEEAQERQLIKWISNEKAILLHGPTGVGKTTLVSNLCNRIKDNKVADIEGFRCIKFSCDRESIANFPRQFKFKKLFSLGKKFIVVLDEVQFAKPEDLIKVSSLWDNKDITSVVYVQINEKPKLDQLVRRIGIHKIKMRTINQEEIEELIKQRTGEVKIFDDDAIKHIAGACNLNPSIALQHCDSIAGELAKPGKAIDLKQVKTFNLDSIKYEKEEILKSETDEIIDKLDLSPLQKKIVKHLRINSMTIRQLADSIEASLGTISKQLNKLSKENKVKIVDQNKPKKYGLMPEFERSLLTD